MRARTFRAQNAKPTGVEVAELKGGKSKFNRASDWVIGVIGAAVVAATVMGIATRSNDDPPHTPTIQTSEAEPAYNNAVSRASVVAAASVAEQAAASVVGETPLTAAQLRASAELGASLEAGCRKDGRCWGKRHQSQANIACAPLLERAARYGAQWTTNDSSPMFSRFDWTDETHKTISYFGRNIELLQQYDGYLGAVYRCDYDPVKDKVVTVYLGHDY
jgi:hypothetical protein